MRIFSFCSADLNDKRYVIALDKKDIFYHLHRSSRKTLALVINHDGLKIKAPLKTTQEEIELLIKKKSLWILKKLSKHIQNESIKTKIPIAGTKFLCCGDIITIKHNFLFDKSHINLHNKYFELSINSWKNIESAIKENELEIKKAAHTFLEKKISSKAADHHLTYQKFALSNAKTRWGSCSISRKIRLNWWLVFLDDQLINYVIAHELAHLIEMNHSKNFWHIVARLMPEFKFAKKKLSNKRIFSTVTFLEDPIKNN